MSPADAEERIESYLTCLRRLKESSSRREIMERELLLTVLAVNKDRLSEVPAQEADQQNLAAALSLRSEPQPAHAYYRDWMGQFLAALTQYDVAVRTGAKDQAGQLHDQILNLEALIGKCIQGYVIITGTVRDDFNDVILTRFGEDALADIDELTHAGFSDDHYWKALLERFVFGFVNKGYGELIHEERFSLSREGGFVVMRFPLDALMALMPGTDKRIDKTRLQAAFHATAEDPQSVRIAAGLSAMLSGLPTPILPAKASKHDFGLLGRVAAMDPAAEQFVETALEHKQSEAAESEETKEREFLTSQLVAMAAGAALGMGTLKEDIGKALVSFSAREQEQLMHVAGAFDPVSLSLAHTFMLEYALSGTLHEKTAQDAGKIQIRSLRHRRARREHVLALATQGFNRIRQKMFFDDDPSAPDWLLFKAKTGQELADALTMANMETRLSHALTTMWTKKEYKIELLVLVNLALVAKATQNVQGKLGEILTRLGVVKTLQA